ncbi:hypothetical protein O181_105505 [Austropuccinia psidii MF-1]|uniref:Uncharacterized protein n=1 Tax=Austropuccinia psidii MF-1 TaxID=1389203 RepID=A0A9Q3PLQ3_9BASI|nr:hypothetical protein [Austropuccinia psidii MF-1]
MEVCDCPQCIKFDFTNEYGNKTQGFLVCQRTCNCHWEKNCQSDQLLSNPISGTILSDPPNSNDCHEPLEQHQEGPKLDHCTESRSVELICLVPEPSQPNMVKINNILSVFINEMIQLNLGIFVQKPKCSNGHMVVVRLGCLIGDLVANHKVSGFASHLATRFCSWCECPKAEIQQLKLERLRQKCIVKDYSLRFKDLKNEAECTRMVKKTGIRWSELNRLGYWDPVQQIPLGIMHNWFEGILQHHFQSWWWWDFEKVKTNKTKGTDNDSDEDFEMQDGDNLAQTGLSWEQGQKMTSALMDITVPFGVTRIPLWLGQEKEGKVKASEWQLLFSIYLPLAAIDTMVCDIHKFSNKPSEATNTLLLIDHLCALVECTHILKPQSIKNAHCLQFTTVNL